MIRRWFENTNFESSNIISNNNSKTENFDGQKSFRTSTKDDLIPSPITKNNNLKESQNNNDNINKNNNLFKIALFQFKRIMMIIYKIIITTKKQIMIIMIGNHKIMIWMQYMKMI